MTQSPPDRLVSSPVFILSAQRSGSTLLRKILDTHSQIHAPSELTLTEVGVKFRRFPLKYGLQTFGTELGFASVGLDLPELEYLLWDRVLHRELTRSGKPVLVHKSPRILLRWRRIAECWPDARYIFLLRHPMSLMTSGQTNGFTMIAWSELRDFHLRFLTLLQEARDNLTGLTVRYEDLTADPIATCRTICDFLSLDFEPGMVEYGSADHASTDPGTGDVSDNILTGRIQPGRALPRDEDIPGPLRPICARLGYPVKATRSAA